MPRKAKITAVPVEQVFTHMVADQREQQGVSEDPTVFTHRVADQREQKTDAEQMTDIIKKIPVNAVYGDVIYYESATGLDYLDCSHQTLSRVSFQLRDIFGNIIDLNGAHISFSIVFSRVQNGS